MDGLYGLKQASENLNRAAFIGETAAMQDVAQSPIMSMAHAIDAANQLCLQIETLANRLVGPESLQKANGLPRTGTPVSEAIFPRIELAAQELTSVVQAAMYNLQRIERALP